MYNRFNNVKLPMASFLVGNVWCHLWPQQQWWLFQQSCTLFGQLSYCFSIIWWSNFKTWLGWCRPYGFFNRLLIQLVYITPWTQCSGLMLLILTISVTSYGAKSLANGTAVIGKTGMYQAGFFPVMMFGYPLGPRNLQERSPRTS